MHDNKTLIGGSHIDMIITPILSLVPITRSFTLVLILKPKPLCCINSLTKMSDSLKSQDTIGGGIPSTIHSNFMEVACGNSRGVNGGMIALLMLGEAERKEVI